MVRNTRGYKPGDFPLPCFVYFGTSKSILLPGPHE